MCMTMLMMDDECGCVYDSVMTMAMTATLTAATMMMCILITIARMMMDDGGGNDHDRDCGHGDADHVDV